MKWILAATGAAILLLLSSGASEAAVLGLESGAYIYNGSSPLNVGNRSAPDVIDWNNDGKKDLLVGDSTGYVWLYLNQGTNTNPVFNGGAKVESSGTAIKVGIASGG